MSIAIRCRRVVKTKFKQPRRWNWLDVPSFRSTYESMTSIFLRIVNEQKSAGTDVWVIKRWDRGSIRAPLNLIWVNYNKCWAQFMCPIDKFITANPVHKHALIAVVVRVLAWFSDTYHFLRLIHYIYICLNKRFLRRNRKPQHLQCQLHLKLLSALKMTWIGGREPIFPFVFYRTREILL